MTNYNTIKTCVFVLFVRSLQCEPTDGTGLTNTTTPGNTTEDITHRPSINDTVDIIKLIKNARGRCGLEDDIVDVLAWRSEAQRQELVKLCTHRYKKDLIEILEHRFMGDICRAVVALLTPHQQLYAHALHDSVDGLGTDEHAISEILGSMSSPEIKKISAIYEDEYNSTLKEDLVADTSGSFRDLIIAMCDNFRSENETVDDKATKFDARALKAASRGNDEEATEKTFISILTSRSFSQLKVIFDKFEKYTNTTILQAIENRFLGDFQYGLLVLAKNVLWSKSEFYAGQLEEALSSVIYDDNQLTRIIVGRSEIDLNGIKEAYKKIYKTDLVDKISAKTGGAYKRLLLILLNK